MAAKPGDSIGLQFTVQGSTGALTNADSLPTAAHVRNGVDDAVSTALTVTNVSTGLYKVTGILPSGYSAGDRYQVRINATAGGVAAARLFDYGVLDKWRITDIVDSSARVDVSKVRGSTVNILQSGRLDAYVGSYAAGQDPGSLVLASPLQKLATDPDGNVFLAAVQSFDNDGQTTNLPADVKFIAGVDTATMLDDGNLLNVDVRAWNGNGSITGVPAVPGDAMTLTAGERVSIGIAVWNTLRSVTFGVNSIGEKIKLWFNQLGTDNRVLVSSDTHTSGETVAGVAGGVGGGGFTADDRATLADIDSRLVGTTITVTSPVTDAGEFTIHKTFDYKHVDSQSIDLSITGAPNLTGATAILLEETDGTAIQAGSVVTAGTGTQTIRFEFARTVTAALRTGRHSARIRATLGNGDQVYLMALTMLVRP